MDLKHLQALLGIADFGSFSAAAEALGTVQSNVSSHVARLERELDVTLVDRGSGHLTEEGQVVAGRARRVMAELDAMVADVVALGHEVVGTVRAGMVGTTGRWLVPQVFDRLRADYPRVRLMVVDGTSASLEPQVATGQLDVAVVTLPVPGEELAAEPLFEEDLMLVVPTDHPLARTEVPLPLAALGGLDLLLPAPGTALREEIDAAVRPAGVTLRPLIELDGLRMIASLTFDGHGPAVLPASAVPGHLRNRFRLLPLEGFPRRRVGVALRRLALPSAPTKAFIEVLHQIFKDPSRVPEGLYPPGTAGTAPPVGPD
jgi:LysR family hydrogen peroxide-inducible transcriptional activator